MRAEAAAPSESTEVGGGAEGAATLVEGALLQQVACAPRGVDCSCSVERIELESLRSTAVVASERGAASALA